MQREGGVETEVPLDPPLMELLKEAAALSSAEPGGWLFTHPVRRDQPYGHTAAEKIPPHFGFKVAMLDVMRAKAVWERENPEGRWTEWVRHEVPRGQEG